MLTSIHSVLVRDILSIGISLTHSTKSLLHAKRSKTCMYVACIAVLIIFCTIRACMSLWTVWIHNDFLHWCFRVVVFAKKNSIVICYCDASQLFAIWICSAPSDSWGADSLPNWKLFVRSTLAELIALGLKSQLSIFPL